jgi:hypothetical protein
MIQNGINRGKDVNIDTVDIINIRRDFGKAFVAIHLWSDNCM